LSKEVNKTVRDQIEEEEIDYCLCLLADNQVYDKNERKKLDVDQYRQN